MVDKTGRSITYNSVKGVVEPNNSCKHYSIKIPILILFGLFLL